MTSWARSLGALALVALLLIGGQTAVQAQPQPAAPPPPGMQLPDAGPAVVGARVHYGEARPLLGTVASVAGRSLTLTTWTGRTVTLQTTPNTRILARETASVADLRSGDHVRVIGKAGPDGVIMARALSDIGAGVFPARQGPIVRRQMWVGGPGHAVHAVRFLAAPGRISGLWGGGPSGAVVAVGQVTGTPDAETFSIAMPAGQPVIVEASPSTRISRVVSLPASSLHPGSHVIVHRMPRPGHQSEAALIVVVNPHTGRT